jgi:outer membrane protein insertion porin family
VREDLVKLVNKWLKISMKIFNKGMRRFLFFFIFALISSFLHAQENTDSSQFKIMDYSRSREYVISDIKVTGVKYLQPQHLVSISGLSKGMKIQIPGPEITNAINKYWRHGLFADVKILVTKIEDGAVDLEIRLEEQPRLNQLEISGINKSERDDIEEKINLKRGMQITQDLINNSVIIIKRHFWEKGYFNIDVDVRSTADTGSLNLVDLELHVAKNKRVKISKIYIEGNETFTDRRLRRTMKKTKQRDLNIFKGSKFIEEEYEADKLKLMQFYGERGYRDAKLLSGEVVVLNKKRVAIKLNLYEGHQFHLRNIVWVGNTKYQSDYLNAVLGMKHGDVYDQKLLNKRLREDEDAVSSVYLDDGYLFFSISPVETKIDNDSIDLEFRIYEGKQATLNNINIKGNTKTNEHVVRRELYTRPGELFSKTDIIRSVRELATLGHFNPETINPTPIPNQADGTVDIDYNLEERANDQLELSGGWGGYYGFMGTVRVKFSNFSARRILDPNAWRPVPSGDGQTFQVGFQSSGKYYQGYNISFIEPWFGGKKPNSFSLSLNYTNSRPYGYNNADTTNSFFKTYGATVGFGKRLKFPDDYFTLYTELSYQQYHLNNYSRYILSDGRYNLVTIKFVLSRSSQDQMIYPRKGSSFSLGLRITPPYSLLNGKDYSDVDFAEKFKFIEFHKWTYSGKWFTSLIQNLVLAVNTEFGFVGGLNKNIGPPPFEKFDVGGDGLTGYSLYGTDVIALRGYSNQSLTPKDASGYDDGNLYTRYYAELRYPFTLNPSATIYGLLFVEGGNCWQTWGEFNPFNIKRSAGVGVRAFLPMFGLLGIDWGYGFDSPWEPTPGYYGKSKGQWHFVLGQQF